MYFCEGCHTTVLQYVLEYTESCNVYHNACDPWEAKYATEKVAEEERMRKAADKIQSLQKLIDNSKGDEVNPGKGAKRIAPPEWRNYSTSASSWESANSPTSANSQRKGQGKVIPHRFPCQRAEKQVWQGKGAGKLGYLQASEYESVSAEVVVDEIRQLEHSEAFSGSTGLPYIQVDLYICIYRVVLYIYVYTCIYIYIYIYIYELSYY